MEFGERKKIGKFWTAWKLDRDGSGVVEVYLPGDSSVPTIRVYPGSMARASGEMGPTEISCCATGPQSPTYMIELMEGLRVAVDIAGEIDSKRSVVVKL